MSEYEVRELILGYSQVISDQFQFWMAATFAAVVVSYTAGERLTFWVRFFVAGLYLAATALFFLRYQGAVDASRLLLERLREIGQFDQPLGQGALAGAVRRIVMLSGTLLATTLICLPAILKRRSSDRDA